MREPDQIDLNAGDRVSVEKNASQIEIPMLNSFGVFLDQVRSSGEGATVYSGLGDAVTSAENHCFRQERKKAAKRRARKSFMDTHRTFRRSAHGHRF